MSSLQHVFLQVKTEGRFSYGGNQARCRKKRIQRYGCGVISSADLLFYLQLYHKDCRTGLFSDLVTDETAENNYQICLEEYNDRVDVLARKYLPVLPKLGLNGLFLAWGLNRYFRRYRIPFHARWGVWPGRLWKQIDTMLNADLPVILAIGPNFPYLPGKHKLAFYNRTQKGDYVQACQVKAHYVTVTAADEKWLQISSWGRKYYINKKEYFDYIKRHSWFLASNMLYLRKKRRL